MRQLLRTIIFATLIIDVITKIKKGSTNKINNEHSITGLEKPDITKINNRNKYYDPADAYTFTIIWSIIASCAIIIIYRFYCHSFCKRLYNRWISRFFPPTPPAERRIRAQQIFDRVYMRQRQEEIHNPPNEAVRTQEILI